MTAVFDACFAIVVGEEGGYTDDPNDPGGETNWGISKAAYPSVDIKNLTEDGAKAIYLRDYWTLQTAGKGLPAFTCDQVPAPLAVMLFDASINNGQERAREWLQAAVGVKADGQIGTEETLPALAKALAATDGVPTLCAEFLARRIDFMGGLKTWQNFGLGWSRRLAALPWKAMALATS